MVITATEFKTHLGKYFEMLSTEDIYITKNGKTIAKLTNPNVSAVDAISGIRADKRPDSFNARMIREERLQRYEGNDRH